MYMLFGLPRRPAHGKEMRLNQLFYTQVNNGLPADAGRVNTAYGRQNPPALHSRIALQQHGQSQSHTCFQLKTSMDRTVIDSMTHHRFSSSS